MVNELAVSIVPFSYYVDGEERSCLDTDAFNGDEYYAAIKRARGRPQVPQRYIEYFEPVLSAGQDIYTVHVLRHKRLMRLRAHRGGGSEGALPQRRVMIVDTLSASLGEGLVVLRAAELRDKGRRPERALRSCAPSAAAYARYSPWTTLCICAAAGRLFQSVRCRGQRCCTKPLLLGNEEGKIIAIAKLRGRKRSIEALAEKFEQLAVAPETQLACIAQAGCREDANTSRSFCATKCHPRDVLIVEYEPMTGAHVGPGALALSSRPPTACAPYAEGHIYNFTTLFLLPFLP